MKFLNAFFPPICLSCKSIGHELCHYCFNRLYLSSKWSKQTISDLEVYSLYTFNQLAFRNLLHVLKYEGRKNLGHVFYELLYPIRKATKFTNTTIVPVPISQKKLKERGFNQTLFLADFLDKPILNILERDDYVSQTKLSKIERWQNVSGKIRAKPGVNLSDLNIIIFDDVITTGATLDECKNALKRAGAKSIFAMTMASG